MSAWKRWVFATDIHGDMADPTVCDSLWRFLKDWKPDVRICGGDLWDFRALRHKASQEEKRDSIAADFSAGMTWLQRFHPDYYERGNHDERLWDWREYGDGIISDYANNAISDIEQTLKKMKCKMLPYNKREGIVQLGHLRFVHGFSGRGGGGSAAACRRHAWSFGNVVVGHYHTADSWTAEAVDHRKAWLSPAITFLEHEYNRADLGALRQVQGWCYGVVNERTGEFRVWQAEQIAGRIITATGYEIY